MGTSEANVKEGMKDELKMALAAMAISGPHDGFVFADEDQNIVVRDPEPGKAAYVPNSRPPFHLGRKVEMLYRKNSRHLDT